MIAALRLLNLSRLRERPLRTALTILAIACGVTLLVAVLIARASTIDALARFDEQRAGAAPLEVVGSSETAGLDEAVLPEVEGVEGVKAAVPLVQVVTVVEDEDGEQTYVAALGVDCRVEAIVGRFGCAEAGAVLSDDAPPFVGPELLRDVGPGGALRTNLGLVPLEDATTLDMLEGINDGRVAIFSLARAQKLFTRDHAFDTILVVPEAGVSVERLQARLQAVVGGHNQVREPGGATHVDMPILPMFFLVGMLALVLGGQLAHNAVALSLEERRRDLAVAGALGADPRTLFVGTLIETGTLGLVGGIIGVGGGILAARPLVASLSGFVSRWVGFTVDVSVRPGIILIGLLLGVGVALVATIGPARRAAAADIAGELHSQGTPKVGHAPPRTERAVAFVLLGLVGIGLAWVGQTKGAVEPWQPAVCQAGLVMAVFFPLRASVYGAGALLGAITSRVPPLRRGIVGVAVDNLVGDARRTGTTALVIGAAVTVGVVVGGIHEVVPAGAADFFAHDAPGAIDVGTVRQTNNAAIAAHVPPEIRQRIEDFPGVASVTGDYYLSIRHPMFDSSVAVESRDGPPASQFPIVSGQSDAVVAKRGEVRIGAAVARQLDLDVGDTLTLPGRTGMGHLRVGSIAREDGELGLAIMLPYDQFERLFGHHAPTSLLVIAEKGVDVDELADRLQADLHDVDPGIEVVSPDEMAREVANEFRAFLTPFWALQRSLMLVAFLAALSTLLLVGLQRRREYGVLAAVGLAPSGLGRMIVVEAALTGAVGTVFGTVAGVFGLVVTQFVGPVVIGVSAPFRFDPTVPVLYGALTTAFVVAGAALPAWRAARLDPTTALRYE